MHGVMMLAIEGAPIAMNTFGSRLVGCPGRIFIVHLDCKVHIDEETIIFLLSEHDVAHRDVSWRRIPYVAHSAATSHQYIHV